MSPATIPPEDRAALGLLPNNPPVEAVGLALRLVGSARFALEPGNSSRYDLALALVPAGAQEGGDDALAVTLPDFHAGFVFALDHGFAHPVYVAEKLGRPGSPLPEGDAVPLAEFLTELRSALREARA